MGRESSTAINQLAFATGDLGPESRHSYKTSHNRTVVSTLPDASRRPSGLKHTETTIPLCPSSVLTHAQKKYHPPGSEPRAQK